MKTHPKIIDKIIGQIETSQTICVVGHMRPDGDCIGSQLGLALALQEAGKKVWCWNQDPVPQKYRFLDPDKIFTETSLLLDDASEYERRSKLHNPYGDGQASTRIRDAVRAYFTRT